MNDLSRRIGKRPAITIHIKTPMLEYHAVLDDFEARQRRVVQRFLVGLKAADAAHRTQSASEPNITNRAAAVIVRLATPDAAGPLTEYREYQERIISDMLAGAITPNPAAPADHAIKKVTAAVTIDPSQPLILPDVSIVAEAGVAVRNGTASIEELTLHTTRINAALTAGMLQDASLHHDRYLRPSMQLSRADRASYRQESHQELTGIFSDKGIDGLRRAVPGQREAKPEKTLDLPKLIAPRQKTLSP